MVEIIKAAQFFSREDEEKATQALAKKYNLPYINLVSYPILPDVLKIIPPDFAPKNKIVAYLRIGKTVRIATTNPDLDSVNQILLPLSQATDYQFIPSLCSETSLRYGLALYQTLAAERAKEEKIKITKKEEEEAALRVKSLGELKEKIAKFPITKVLDLILAGAVASDASDIHIEPGEEEFLLRYRIDGVLQEITRMPPTVYKALLSRIKYLAKLKLDITTNQDGRFDAQSGSKKIDIRVSTLPTQFGEAIEMRLLVQGKKFLGLEELGFSQDIQKQILEAIKKPHGIIFNTGPTGSGKTTTLYAILNLLNKPGRKIITLEDPIEYQIPGIDQVGINPAKGFDFLEALKGALRQDPDILMIGEIRDAETAQTALHAALTGHLVLTTFHANSAPAIFPRILDMGVEPYLLSGTINLIIAQRLVRRIHQVCQGKGCQICNQTGYKGRIAIAEVLVPDQEIEKLIAQKTSLPLFEEAARKAGMIPMIRDGMDKVRAGITTEEEVKRVTQE